MKHVIQHQHAGEYISVIESIYGVTPSRCLHRNYLLNQFAELDNIDLVLKDLPSNTA